MGYEGNRRKDLAATREALTSWRREHGGRGRPIPAVLWSDAAEVARADGVAKTARALGLDAHKLGKLVKMGTESAARSMVEPAGFVALEGLALGPARDRGRAVVELFGREGDRVHVEVSGEGGGIVDLVALVRAFWGRNA